MTATTIKVDTQTRDRLAALARQRGLSVNGVLTDLLEKAEKEARWVSVRVAYEQLQADPKAWSEYLAEGVAWTDASDRAAWADHDAARQEYPEYNA